MAAVTKVPSFMHNLRKWAYNLSGFNKYGLFHDDLLYENDDVKEALKRLPNRLHDERNYRIIRASQLSMQKIILPEDQWTKWEDDIAHRYLEPFIEDAKREREEREVWNSNH